MLVTGVVTGGGWRRSPAVEELWCPVYSLYMKRRRRRRSYSSKVTYPCEYVIALYRYIAIHINVPLHCPPT